ncbi:MAG: hypothetical protein Phyf2KO_07990 [Phycisphaerales bacterium]
MSKASPARNERRIWPAQEAKPSSARWHRASLGLKRIVRRLTNTGTIRTPEGIRYRPVGHLSLTRSLSKRGPGYKEYDVQFPLHESMRVKVEPSRVFADLTGPRFASERELLAQHIRPGSRALIINAGTGDTAAWIADLVGPSGAVVALDLDEQSVEFAKRRYDTTNTTFEQGDGSLLAGEPDEGFEFVLAPRAFSPSDEGLNLTPLFRLVAPGGSLAISTASGSVLALSLVKLLDDVSAGAARTSVIERAGISVAIATRPI